MPPRVFVAIKMGYFMEHTSHNLAAITYANVKVVIYCLHPYVNSSRLPLKVCMPESAVWDLGTELGTREEAVSEPRR